MTFEQWLARPQSTFKSRWRWRAYRVMHSVVTVHGDVSNRPTDARRESIVASVEAAYPFGQRKYHPYRAWLAERKLLIDALTPPLPTPAQSEIDACEVARDMLEYGRIDEARALLEREAPNRLNRACPTCDADPGEPCTEPELIYAGHGNVIERGSDTVVPHRARIVGRVEPGPLPLLEWAQG